MKTLHIDSIQKHFNNKCILSDIYLACKTNEVIGVLGRNGSGKSTLFKIIQGSLFAEQEFVKIDNKIILNKNKRHHYLHYLPQENFLPKHIRLNKISKLFIHRKRLKEFYNINELQFLLNKRKDQLSTGQRRFFEILLFIYSDCHFLILDEPFNGLSPKSIEFIKVQIQKEKANKGIIISDHDYRNVLSITDRLYFLEDCSLKEIKNKEELKKQSYLPKNAFI